MNLAGLYTWDNSGAEPGTEPVSATSPGNSIYDGTNDTLETSEFDSNNYIKDITKISVEEFTNIIEKIADARAENGAEQQRVNQSMRLQQNNLVNLEAAQDGSWIPMWPWSPPDWPPERQGASKPAMVAQANQMTSVALSLLQ